MKHPNQTTPSRAAIACSSVSVSFGQVRAAVDVSLELARGGIHALVGENGAGKSTLSHVLAGLRRPDAGQVWIEGNSLQTGHVASARSLGVAMVQQHDALPRQLTVAEALELFEPSGRGTYRRGRLTSHWQQRLASFGVVVDAGRRLAELPVETVQAVDIARALASSPKVLILDEPTSLLAPKARDLLFDRLRAIAAEGVTVVVVLHKLSEVYAVADTVTAMRSGAIVAGPSALSDVTPRDLVQAMTGRDEGVESPWDISRQEAAAQTQPTDRSTGVPVLRLERVSVASSDSEPGLEDVSLRVFGGEVLGIAAVSGNGERLAVETVVGLATPENGELFLCGESASQLSVGQRRQLGLGVLPFDRNREALSRSAPLWQNVAIGELIAQPRSSVMPISVKTLRLRAAEALNRWNVRFAHVGQAASTLSGGNAQRLVLARELHRELRLLVAANPTTGLDLVSTEAVRSAIAELRANGVGVLLVTQDLDELLALSDRVLVLHRGRVAGEFEKPFSVEAIGSSMLGAAV